MSAVAEPASRLAAAAEELTKIGAFARRDFLVALSYRFVFFTDIINLCVQALAFSLIGLMVDPSVLPRFGGREIGYQEFVVIGIALGAFVQIGLGHVANALRQEQLMGTLESLLVTPTATATLQVGAVAYDLVYIPIRTFLFLLLVAVIFGIDFAGGGILPAAVMILLFIPFVWGLGIASAATTLTFRRGGGIFGMGVGLLTLGSGAYFPIELLPGWAFSITQYNPMALAVSGMRNALLGGEGFADLWTDMLLLAPMSVAALAAGVFAFRKALARERRLGTLGLY